jgi:hypothetical protein
VFSDVAFFRVTFAICHDTRVKPYLRQRIFTFKATADSSVAQHAPSRVIEYSKLGAGGRRHDRRLAMRLDKGEISRIEYGNAKEVSDVSNADKE